MQNRLWVIFVIIILMLLTVSARLFYWQVVMAEELRESADAQHISSETISPRRGEIFASDGFPLVQNKPIYSLTAYTPNIENSPSELTDLILPNLSFEIEDPEIATDEARREDALEELEKVYRAEIIEKLSSRTWSVLARSLDRDQKSAIQGLGVAGLGFEETFVRSYPEASMSAHLIGFVGKDQNDTPTGYFGLEGFYDRELSGRGGLKRQELDALGSPLLFGDYRSITGIDGRDLVLNLDRSAQYLVEQELRQGLERYGAVAGEVIVMDPYSGAIIALSAFPNYDPPRYWKYDTAYYKNPSIANTYEPGSTFKVLVMAAAIDSGAVVPDDKCDICGGSLRLDKYTINTWNSEYHNYSSPEEILVNSDNVGMVWIQQKMGGDRLVEYIENFGFGEKTGIDLQEEISAPLREKWSFIDHATASFGQGIAVTSIQMIRAVAAIANGGDLVEPHVVKSVVASETIDIKPKVIRRVLDQDSARIVKDMMVASAEHGESKWTKIKGYKIAGKTGTSQIPVAGHYDEDKTIASFIGFAPADNPRFVMLVKLQEPTSSPWGSETAAPLWYNIANKLLLHLNVPPT